MLSEAKIISIFCIVDDMPKASGHMEKAFHYLCFMEVLAISLFSKNVFLNYQNIIDLFYRTCRVLDALSFRTVLQATSYVHKALLR